MIYGFSPKLGQSALGYRLHILRVLGQNLVIMDFQIPVIFTFHLRHIKSGDSELVHIKEEI